jgi:outer membrane protein assembly factor BamB
MITVGDRPLYGQSPPHSLLWRAPLVHDGAPTPTGKPAYSEGFVYIGTNTLDAYDALTGKLRWSTPFRKTIPKGIVAGGGLVFVAEATVSAHDSMSGEVRWTFIPSGSAALAIPVLHDHRLFIGTEGHVIYCLDASTGAKRWEADIDPSARYRDVVTALAVKGDSLYISMTSFLDQNGAHAIGRVISVNTASGSLKWRYSTSGRYNREGVTSSVVPVGGSLVFADSLSNVVHSLDASTGQELWSFAGRRGFIGPVQEPTYYRGVLYVGSGDTNVYALDPNSGKELWHMTTKGSVTAIAHCGAQLAAFDQRITWLSFKDGTILSGPEPPSAEEIISSQPSTSEGALYIAGPEALYAISCLTTE